jgi:dTDP-4-amino-4,6-dideoxygalactose transaminase
MFGGAVSERLFREGLCLPSGSSLAEEDQARVVATIRGMCRA